MSKLKKIGTFLLALLLCVGMCPMAVMAEGDELLPEIVYWEDFSCAQATGKINTSGSDRTIATQNGIFVATTKPGTDTTGTTYSFENGTLDYITKVSGDYIDLRLSRGSVMEKDLMQDFVLSFKIKPDTDTLTAGFYLSGRYEHSATVAAEQNGFTIKNGKLYAGSTLASDKAVLPANEWSLVEIAFHYNETLMPDNPVLGAGAIDSYTIMLNGEALCTANLNYYVKSYDFFRMFRYTSGATFELDDLRIALGSQSLKSFDENGGEKAESYAQNFSWFDVNENAMTDYAYSFCVVGDTQILNMDDYMSRTEGSKLYDTYDGPTNYMATLYDWIVANVGSKKIAHVFGLGDITDDNTNLEWEIAKEQIGKLNGVVPYSLVRGNHDGTEKYNNAFAGNTAYTEQFEGFYQNGKVDDSYKRFTVGGTKYLVFTLNNGAKDDVLAWAGSIIEQYPDHKVIITTHAYLSEDGDTLKSGDADTPSKNGEEYNDGNEMWDKLVSKYENIFLVMSGHVDTDYVVCTQSMGVNGNTVTQLLVDPQGLDEEVGSTSMVTMLYFSEDGETVSVETYSTVRNQYFAKENQFIIQTTNDTLNEIYSNDFESCTTADIPKNVGGTVVLGAENCGHSVADGVLNINKTGAGYVSLRPVQGNADYKVDGATPIEGNVTLSFDIKVNNNTDKIGALYCGNEVVGAAKYQFMSVALGKVSGFGKDTDMKIGEWNTVKVVFNYDAANEKYSSFTVILNGEELHTKKIDSSITLSTINEFTLFRWGDDNASFALDNLIYKYGKDVRGAGKATEIWGVDFEGVTNLPTNAARLNNMRVMNNYLPTTNTAAKSHVANGILSLVSGGGQAFIDLNPDASFGYYGDMTLTMKLRATSANANGGTVLTVNYDSTKADVLKFASQNQIKLNKSDAVVADLSLYRFTTVEVMFRFDYASATYTSVALFVNGEFVDSMGISGWSQIKWFRAIYVSDGIAGLGADVDEIRLTKNCQSLYKGETAVTEFIGYQTTAIADNAFNLRLLSVMTDRDLSKYECVGYNVTATYKYNNQTISMVMPEEIGKCTKVFTSVLATENMTVASEITAETLGGEYIIAVNCIGLPADCGDIEFTVSTYYKLNCQDAAVTERAFTFTVSPADNANQGGVN